MNDVHARSREVASERKRGNFVHAYAHLNLQTSSSFAFRQRHSLFDILPALAMP